MINHPHDCPVCDEGGECHLQDMTVMTGHNYRKYRFEKRTYRNQNLGPFIEHEMNRCIHCYRCLRFYTDYAGGRDFGVFGINKNVYFGRFQDGPLENEFSGNLVEICPTGVFTDKTFRKHYTRKWDLQTAPSICVHCGWGCNTIPGERYGTLRRITNRYNHQVNGYFLCDRGRFGYDFVNGDRRIKRPLLRSKAPNGETKLDPQNRDAILNYLQDILASSSGIIGIGSPRASLESNFALRTMVGPERFYTGMSDNEHHLVTSALAMLRGGPAPSASLLDAERSDAVLVLGEDVTNTAARLALGLHQSVLVQPMAGLDKLHIPRWNDAAARQAIQDNKGPLFMATPFAVKLDNPAARTYRGAPDDIARLGFAIAAELDTAAPRVADLPEEVRTLAIAVAQALRDAKRPLVVSGTGLASAAVIQAAANVAWALSSMGRNVGLCFLVPECNSLGVALTGGGSLSAAFEEVNSGRADTVIIIENDLYRRAESDKVKEFLSRAKNVVTIDHVLTRTASESHVVLPAGTFAETSGTLVNSEGRGQRFFQVFVPAEEIQATWKWLRDLMPAAGAGKRARWQSLDDVIASMSETLEIIKPVTEIAPDAAFRLAGRKIPRQPHRWSGRTAVLANVSVHEPAPPDDPDSPLAFSMEGYEGRPPPALIPRFWAPGWNSIQALNKFQSEVGGPLLGGDPGRRLIEPARVERAPYFDEVPPAFQPRSGEWLLVPAYHLFGSEELSTLGPAIAERAVEAYIGLSDEDAKTLGLAGGDRASLVLENSRFSLVVRTVPGLRRGMAAVPVGLPGLEGVRLPQWGQIFGDRA
jgi:NADH-quinone oxidoreductase subunit G